MVKNIELLEKLRRRATRMLEECVVKSYKERLEIVGLTTLESRRTKTHLIESVQNSKGV